MSDVKWDAKLATYLADVAMDEYSSGYEKAYKNIPDMADQLRAAVEREKRLKAEADLCAESAAIFKDERDRLAAENERLQGNVALCALRMDQAACKLDYLRVELRLARAVVEAAKSVSSEEGMRESLTCYVMGVELIDRIDAYDAHVAAKGEP